MSDDIEGVVSAPEGNGAGVDPTAVALALAGASREKADAFLDDQRALIADQRRLAIEQHHHLQRQYTQLCLDIWQTRLGVWLRAATFCVGITAAGSLAFLVWDASRSNGLLIEPFSVPPDLAGRGVTGEVVAAQVHDRLVAMQEQSTSNRAAKTYANSWDETGIKLDIPETGVSMAELDSFLRKKLGHDTHVQGEIIRTDNGLNLTVRAGADGADSVSGSETELDAIIQRSAESVYRLTQPYRYAFYLASNNRQAEAVPIFMALARRGPPLERPWGYLGWSSSVSDSQGVDNYLRLMKQTLALQPDNVVALVNIAQAEDELSLPEQAMRDAAKALLALSGSSQTMIRAESIPSLIKTSRSISERQSGAFHESATELAEVVPSGIGGVYGQPAILAPIEIGEHDLTAARTAMSYPDNPSGPAHGRIPLNRIRAQMLFDTEVEDWAKIPSHAHAVDPILTKYPGIRASLPSMISPLLAFAEAKLGKFAAAEARMTATPISCYRCLIARARIAELEGQHGRADWWFARAVNNAPSIPFADSYWGDALLARGDNNGAIAKFTIANQKGRHFADPLEGWGEALMAKNQSHLALAKFEEAEKYAPNWGRLHLKWSEALAYAGKKDEAKAQFARAAQLDLTPSEKVELKGRSSD